MLWIADRQFEELTGEDNEGKKGAHYMIDACITVINVTGTTKSLVVARSSM